MKTLDELRLELDLIDSELLALLKRRTEISHEVGEYKKNHGLPIYVPGREQEILNRLQERAKEVNLSEEFIAAIYSAIFEESRKIQVNLSK